MFRKVLSKLLLLSLLCSSQIALAVNYENHPVAEKWMSEMLAQGFSKKRLSAVLKNAKRQSSILKAMNRQAEGSFSWEKYRSRFVETKRIQNGRKFWQKNKKALMRAQQEYGVPAQVIVSIIGVETRYGKVMGNYRVLDALATIAFDLPRRGEFFRNELAEFLRLTKEENISITKPRGSFAGAMGIGQFLPSSFRQYAIDFDGDGKRDIWSNPADAIGSVANYLAKFGWDTDQPVAVIAKTSQTPTKEWYNIALEPKVSVDVWAKRKVLAVQPLDQESPATLMKFAINNTDQYWLGLQNFYVITRYNHSRYYAMAVYQLSQLIKKEMKLG